MKRYLLLTGLLVLLFTAACGAAGEIGKQELVVPTAAPTATAVAEAETEKSLYDDFSQTVEGWEDVHVVTSQAVGKPKSGASLKEGMLVFDFQEMETYLYKFYGKASTADVVIEAKVQGTGKLQNGMALVCRASEDKSAWYEARVTSVGKYGIYRFDQSAKDAGKNPYALIKEGGLPVDVFGPTKENVVRFTCQGDQLKLEANGNELATAQDANLSEGGLPGVGAMSSNELPVSIRFDYFSYGQP